METPLLVRCDWLEVPYLTFGLPILHKNSSVPALLAHLAYFSKALILGAFNDEHEVFVSDNLANFYVHTLLRARDWQDRSEFESVIQWWRRGGHGLCALVGMGGAGKTAIVERFLRVLPNGLPADSSLGKDVSLRAASSTFVFSFYDSPDPDSFFRHLQMWLHGGKSSKPKMSLSRMLFLLQNTSGLLVLDGLETVQDDRVRGAFGHVNSPELREVLDHISAGNMAGLSVLVSSRFPLADLRNAHPQFFERILIDQIAADAGIQLLRRRGVLGNDHQLSALVERCGRHALTVDFVGGYITEFCDGAADCPLNLDSTDEIDVLDASFDPAKTAVSTQGRRVARIAERYRESMGTKDEAAIALLEKICLFQVGASFEMLTDIFIGTKAVTISGIALANLDPAELKRKLNWLSRLRLIEEITVRAESEFVDQNTDSKIFTIHPAIRDGFLRSLNREVAKASHEAIWKHLEVSLGSSPGVTISDPRMLDLIEEVIHHALATGNSLAAWDLYQNRMGGCRNLLAGINDYVRVSRITKAIRQAHENGAKVGCEIEIVLCSDSGYSNLSLGCLDSAKCSLEKGLALCRESQSSNLSVLSTNLAHTYYAIGNIGAAIAMVRELLELKRDSITYIETAEWLAELNAEQGKVQTKIEISDVPLHLRQLPIDRLPLIVRSEYLDSGQLSNKYLEDVHRLEREHPRGHESLANALLEFAASAARNLELQSAFKAASEAFDWAVTHQEKSLLIRAHLIRSQIYLAGFGSVNSGIVNARDEVARGRRLASDCGFGLLHIDLIIAQARVHLALGDPLLCLDELKTALETGVLANKFTGQPELMAATHPSCNYVWGIAAGLFLRGKAMLLQAAQMLGRNSFVPANMHDLPTPICALLSQAEENLIQALDLWQSLRDPEPQNVNFRHPQNGREYNYRAAETYKIITELKDGLLPSVEVYDSGSTPLTLSEPGNAGKESSVAKRFLVALTFAGEHRDFVRQVAEALAASLTRKQVFYDEWYEVELLGAGGDLKLQSMYENADLVVPFFSQYYDKPWCSMEWETVRGILLNRRKDDAVVPVHLDDTKITGWSAVNFGIHQKGRTANQIATIIVERLNLTRSRGIGNPLEMPLTYPS